MSSKCKHHFYQGFGIFLLFGVIPALMLSTGCTFAPVKLENETLLSQTDEQMLWCRAKAEQHSVIASEKLYADSALADYINRVVALLRPRACPPQLEFKVYIANNPRRNAYTYPNGLIVITTGLLARLENEAQLAAVLAHEMAHCIGRDALRLYRRCSGTKTVQLRAAHSANRDESRSGFGKPSEELSDCIQEVVRERESVADASSLDMLVAAQYDPAEAVRAIHHQKEALSRDGLADLPHADSHPLWYERVSALEKQVAALQPGTGSVKRGRTAYQGQIEQVLLLNARLNLRYGRYRWARNDLKRYLQIRPGDARAHHLLGDILQQQGGVSWIENAQACYREAIRLDRNYAEPHKALGLLHYKQGRKQLARGFFQTALALAPDDKDNAYIAVYLAECPSKGEP
jgi:predicted Zn-dependent protease